ncbi:MAG: hypothetical protein NTW86_08785, partial [Candidatus Sumerlaeota bacterium]|nr:hypothetical protein [Candidatus Sumerlaeota bacterium]
TDGLAMLDFLGHGMQTIAREAVTGLVKPGFEFVVAEQERWTNLGDLKLAARYGRLRSYYESRLSIWQTDTTSPTR